MEKREIPILVYHNVSSEVDARSRRWAVSPEMFEGHLAYLSRHGYTSMTVTQFINARSDGQAKLPRRPVILTFDDGSADFYEQALPALRRHDFVATLYVVTGWVGGKPAKQLRTDESPRSMVTWSQLEEIAASGIECGGHSHTHPKLDAISQDAAQDEIVRCKALLEGRLGRTVFSFAYPHGWYTKALERMVRAAGFTSACAVKNMRSSLYDNAFELSRLVVTDETDVGGLEQLLARHVSWSEIKLRDVARQAIRIVPRSQARVAQWQA